MSDTDIQVYPMMIYFNCWFHTPITHNYKFVNCPPVNVYILCKHRCGKPTMKMIFRTRFPMVFPHLLCLPYIEGPTDFRPSRHFATCRRRSRTPHVSGAMASDMFCFFGWEIRKVMSYDLRNPKNRGFRLVPEHIIYRPLDAIGCEKWIFVSKPIHPLVVGLAARRGSRDETFSGNQHEKTSGYIGYM